MRGIVTKKGNQNIGPAETMSRSSQRTWGDGALPAGVLARPAGSCGRGVFVEEGTTNLFTAPEAAGTLPTTKTLAAGTYAVSAYGGGSIDVTGADATVCAGPDGADCKTFTLAAQTDVTFAANGVVSKCQLELKACSTNWQNPILGARAAETLTLPTYVPATATELAECAYGVNLLTANQADGTDTSAGIVGFGENQGGEVISSSTDKAKSGSRSLRIITPGALVFEGANCIVSTVVPNRTYAVGAWVFGASGTVVVRFREATSSGSVVGVTASNTITLNGTWQYVPVVRVFGATGTKAYVFFATDTAQAITFYVDQLSLERVPSADSLPGSWVPGQQKRLVDASRGTVVIDFLSNPSARRQITSVFPTIFALRKANTGPGFHLYHSATSTNWYMSIIGDNAIDTGGIIADSLIPDGWHRIVVAYDSASARVYVDGILRRTINNPNLPSALYLNAVFGSLATYHLNTACDNIALYSAAMSADWCAAHGKPGAPPPVNEYCTILRTFDAPRQVSRIGGRR